ncbi:MAG: dTDP-glucose 4,6-dehydratase [Ardenticatenaceae bacterium]|nr:dTDP-glucose 4,6-dehydratase [Ardenticatenaceae bacterium]
MKNLMVTGGAGFIGANFVHHMLGKYDGYRVVVFDKLTYAGNLDNLLPVKDDPRYAFIQGDICDAEAVDAAIEAHDIDTIVNFAAETHVDRSILDPDAFVQTSVYGTYVLLEAAKKHGLERYHQISTDEVYGDIPEGYSSVESDALRPRSPYAASKASADLMVQAYHITYGLPITITRGSNNIGPYQYPEKVVPLFTTNAMDDKPLPLYGDGRQKREYQYVGDHCSAIDLVLHKGVIGDVYNIGTGVEVENIDMVKILLDTVDKPHDLIRHVTDRAGHDRRYSLNIGKILALGWEPDHTPEEAIAKSVAWYRDNEWWWRKVRNEDFESYYQVQYGKRLAS